MGTNILHKVALAQKHFLSTATLLTTYWNLFFSISTQLWGNGKKSVLGTDIWSHARATLTPDYWKSHCSECISAHLTWAERRVRGMWKGWAGWACWRRLRRRRRVHQSPCRVPLLLAAPTAEHHSWREKKHRQQGMREHTQTTTKHRIYAWTSLLLQYFLKTLWYETFLHNSTHKLQQHY